MRCNKSVVGLAFVLAIAGGAAAAAPNWAAVTATFGRDPIEQPGGIHRYDFPRTDLAVTVDGGEIKAGFALGSWLAFTPMGDMVMVMGDLVVLHTEVPDVVRALSEGGIDITAVRRHLLRAEPFPLHVHVEGIGDATQMAAALKVALEVMATSMEPLAAAGEQPRRTIGTADIEGIIGREGTAGGAGFRYSIPRAEEITACRMTVPNPLGLGIANNFQPIGEGRAAITGDFVLVADEVNPVVAALRRTGSK